MGSKKYFVLLFLFVLGKTTLGQDKIKLIGIIEDCATKKPLPNATIQCMGYVPRIIPLYKKTTTSDANGKFTIEVPNGSKNSFTINLIGYETYDPRSLQQCNSNTDSLPIGFICLKPSVKGLKEVEVVAHKELLQLKADRIIYDVKNDKTAAANNIQTLVSRLPFFSLSSDGKLLYKNSPRYKVFIDGRPSGLARYDPNMYLQTVQGQTVDKIEIITSPTAKYDMEGNSIIINVITKKMENGYSINLNSKGDSFGALGGGGGYDEIRSLGFRCVFLCQ
ncbi:peptidase associated domain and porin domain-containing protein [Solitalea koreensis]|nr:hypothetical protein [Solitalea koreensis]